MSVVPESIVGRIEFGEEHVDPWTANAVGMGSSAPTVTAWSGKVTAARAAYQAQKAAQNAAKAATNALKLAMEAMDRATSEVVQQVRTKALAVGDSVYTLAEIPAPATPTPVGDPGTPYGTKVTLNPNGSIQFAWKCDNPAGCNSVIYQVYRKNEAAGEYHYLGGSGQRRFVDATVPAGAGALLYQIQATRSTSVGTAAEFTVNLGVTTGGGMTASIASPTGLPAKIAA